MSLLDLPPELLALIAQHVGPAELRKSFDYLLVSRAWYWAVLPIYLSGLQLSNTNPLLSQAIQKTVTRLSLCLDGLPSRDTLSWDDQREFSEETHQWLDQTIYYHRNGSAETLQKRLKVVIADGKIQPRIREEDEHWWVYFEGAIDYRDRVRDDEIQEAKELEYRLSNWRGRLNDRLSRFAEILSASKQLCEVKIETTLTPDGITFLHHRWGGSSLVCLRTYESYLGYACIAIFKQRRWVRTRTHLCHYLATSPRFSDCQNSHAIHMSLHPQDVYQFPKCNLKIKDFGDTFILP